MLKYKILSALLQYPEQELLDALPEIRNCLAEAGFSDEQHAVVAEFVAKLETAHLTDAQADYVKTFDLTPEHSLHLMHHLYADDRRLGPAMIDLTEYYKGLGWKADEKELPDFLPLILEFSAHLDDAQATAFLNRTVGILAKVAVNLEKAGSDYAPLIRIIEQWGQLERIAA